MTTITRISKDKGEFYLLWLSSGENCVSRRYFSTAASAKRPRVIRYFNRRNKKASSYDVGLQMAMNYLSYQLRSKKEILLI